MQFTAKIRNLSLVAGLVALAISVAAQGASLVTLAAFNGRNGANPAAGLIADESTWRRR